MMMIDVCEYLEQELNPLVGWLCGHVWMMSSSPVVSTGSSDGVYMGSSCRRLRLSGCATCSVRSH